MTDMTGLVVPIRIAVFPDNVPGAGWVNMASSCVASIGFWYGVAWAVTKGVTMAL